MLRQLEVGNNGKRLGPGWETMDLNPGPETDVVHDLSVFPYPFEDGSFSEIYLCHVLEHIPWYKTVDVLKELHRITAKDGCIEIHVPDFRKMVEGYYMQRPIEDDWFAGNPQFAPGLWINGRVLCGQVDDDHKDDHWWHKAIFDRSHLTWCLYMAGFKDIHVVKEREPGKHGWIDLGLQGWKV